MAMDIDEPDRQWDFRVKSQSDRLVRRAAGLVGISVSEFVEDSAVAHAESVLTPCRLRRRSPAVFERFVEALDEAPVAVPQLVDLFSRPSRIPLK
jgi:uncharacterized protein (DUF1778 family)